MCSSFPSPTLGSRYQAERRPVPSSTSPLAVSSAGLRSGSHSGSDTCSNPSLTNACNEYQQIGQSWRFSDRSEGGCPGLPTLSFSVAESNCMIRLATWPNRLPCNNCRPSSVPPSPRQSTRRKLALPNSIAYGQVLLQARRDSCTHACPVQPHLSTDCYSLPHCLLVQLHRPRPVGISGPYS